MRNGEAGRETRLRRALAQLLLFCLLLLTVSGCAALPASREVESLTLMRTMGVDAAEEGAVLVTVSGGAQNGGGENRPPVVLSTTADTISGACLSMQSRGEEYVFYGHVGQLLLGEALAKRGMDEALGYVERDIEMRLDTQLFLVRDGTAEESITAAAGEKTAATDVLEAMKEDAALMASFTPRTVKDALAGLAQNKATFVPAIVAGEEGALLPAGYGIVKEGRLSGWAEGEAALGVNLLLGSSHADVLELPGKVALRLVGVKTSVSAVMQGDVLVGLELDCAAQANVAQAPAALNLTDKTMRERLCAALAERVRTRILETVALSQTLDADFAGLKTKAALAAPWHRTALEEQWDDTFSTLPVTVRVKGDIQRSYDVKG